MILSRIQNQNSGSRFFLKYISFHSCKTIFHNKERNISKWPAFPWPTVWMNIWMVWALEIFLVIRIHLPLRISFQKYFCRILKFCCGWWSWRQIWIEFVEKARLIFFFEFNFSVSASLPPTLLCLQCSLIFHLSFHSLSDLGFYETYLYNTSPRIYLSILPHTDRMFADSYNFAPFPISGDNSRFCRIYLPYPILLHVIK